MNILVFQGVSKSYSEEAPALKDVTLTIREGEFTALAGPSGSGKTTLLNMAAGLDVPSHGTVSFLGHELQTLGADTLARMRRKHIGFVFQSYNLFPVMNALENVEYPLALNHIPDKVRHRLAQRALEDVGLGEFAKRFPNQLSGGQQQRVAIARAIVNGPKIVFADEPTANLDSVTSEKLLQLFRQLNESKGISFLFSSHDPMVLKIANRVVKMVDGQIKSDSFRKKSASLVKATIKKESATVEENESALAVEVVI